MALLLLTPLAGDGFSELISVVEILGLPNCCIFPFTVQGICLMMPLLYYTWHDSYEYTIPVTYR